MGLGVALGAWVLNEDTFAWRWGRGVGSKTPEGLRRGDIGQAGWGDGVPSEGSSWGAPWAQLSLPTPGLLPADFGWD